MLDALLKDPEKIGVVLLLVWMVIGLLKTKPWMYSSAAVDRIETGYKNQLAECKAREERLLNIALRSTITSERTVDELARKKE
jgi:hypothetical protein